MTTDSKQVQQHTGVMETRGHFKNGAILKSLTSKANFLKSEYGADVKQTVR